ncbi:MAG TPA: InlB B-repeat-containing protein, partial [Candidatus Paenibacillus intestinavium]|nr:InlB B-repeat-containing protein [Candidatus Paenibacillus intestinavium]
MKKFNIIILLIALIMLVGTIQPSSVYAESSINWSKPIFQVSGNMKSVIHGSDRFITAGDAGKMKFAKDGNGGSFSGTFYWPADKNFNDIAYANGKYVVVGESGKFMSLSFNDQGQHVIGKDSAYGSNDLSGVTYGNGKFVATGQSGTIITSSDGEEWEDHSLSLEDRDSYIYDVTYGNMFVAVGQDGKIWMSPDGETWTNRESNTTNDLQDVAYGDGMYVAVGVGGTIITSPDGENWTVQMSGISTILEGVTYGNGLFVAVGNEGKIVTSADGSSWTLLPSGTENYLLDVTFGDGTFIVVGDNINLTYEYPTIIYNGNNNTGGSVPSDIRYAIGGSATVLGNSGNLVKTGHLFEGWNTAADGEGTDYIAGDSITFDMENVTLYAKWLSSYEVTFEDWDSTVLHRETVNHGATATAPTNPSRTGYTFIGWDVAYGNITGELTVKA